MMPAKWKSLEWIGSSRADMRQMPKEVRRTFGAALLWAQQGNKHPNAKMLSGFGSAGVLEVMENFDTDTYRAVYAVRFAEAVYVLHVFQKKSKSGVATPKSDMNLIRTRLKRAEEMHRQTEEEKL